MRTQLRPAIVSVLAWTILLGLVFPGVVTIVANILFPFQAHGSLIVRNGKVVGSELIGQNFALPIYFHPRPSAAGNGYDPTSSGGTNLAPTTDKLINGLHHGPKATDNFDGIKDLATAYRQENNLWSTTPLPTDAVTRSGSGLDPDISVENALLQALAWPKHEEWRLAVSCSLFATIHNRGSSDFLASHVLTFYA